MFKAEFQSAHSRGCGRNSPTTVKEVGNGAMDLSNAANVQSSKVERGAKGKWHRRDLYFIDPQAGRVYKGCVFEMGWRFRKLAHLLLSGVFDQSVARSGRSVRPDGRKAGGLDHSGGE